MLSYKTLIVSSFLSAWTLAAPSPSTPATTPIGASQTFTWDLDTTGVWTSASIILKSGANLNMTEVVQVTSGIDCTKTNSFTWQIPAVTPTSAIYFYEFDQVGASDGPVWTTRWAISDATGKVSPAQHKSQPNGDAIPWGEGRLANGAAVITSTLPIGGNTTTSSSVPLSVPTSNGFLISETTVVVVTQSNPLPTTTGLTTPALSPSGITTGTRSAAGSLDVQRWSVAGVVAVGAWVLA